MIYAEVVEREGVWTESLEKEREITRLMHAL
jgi:hypothetical protein